MAGGMLGIVITKYENLEHIMGVVKAARAAGHPVAIFMTDKGVKFATDPKFKEILKIDGVTITLCDHSCGVLGITERTEGITYGSQYNHATLLHDSARALVF